MRDSVRISIHALIIILVAYGSAYYGLLNGFSYGQSFELVDADTAVSNLKKLESGEYANAKESLEGQIHGNLMANHFSRFPLVNIYPWIGSADRSSDEFFLRRIVEYDKEYTLNCTLPSEVCDTTKKIMYGE